MVCIMEQYRTKSCECGDDVSGNMASNSNLLLLPGRPGHGLYRLGPVGISALRNPMLHTGPVNNVAS